MYEKKKKKEKGRRRREGGNPPLLLHYIDPHKTKTHQLLNHTHGFKSKPKPKQTTTSTTTTTTTHAPDDVDDFFATVPRVGLRSGVRIGRHVLRRGGFGFTFFFSDAGDDEREEKARDAFAGERKARANERDEQRNARKIERSGIVEG